MNILTKEDLEFINTLGSRKYPDNKILSNASIEEKERLSLIKTKLKNIVVKIFNEYNDNYGPFSQSVSSGNPISLGGTLQRVWCGVYKGCENKQYATQISCVIGTQKPSLEVGFYFGRASNRSLSSEKKDELLSRLIKLGEILSNEIENSSELYTKINLLIEEGFKISVRGKLVSLDEWIKTIKTEPYHCEIFYEIQPDRNNNISFETINYYISLIVDLTLCIPNNDESSSPRTRRIYVLTPEQRAKQAELRTLRGEKGEQIVLEFEKNKLEKLNLGEKGYPIHISLNPLQSENYDIKSLDENGEEIFIEVKSTIRREDDEKANEFYITDNELKFYYNNQNKYYLYRVYDIEENPTIKKIEMNKIKASPVSYLAKF